MKRYRLVLSKFVSTLHPSASRRVNATGLAFNPGAVGHRGSRRLNAPPISDCEIQSARFTVELERATTFLDAAATEYLAAEERRETELGIRRERWSRPWFTVDRYQSKFASLIAN